MNLRYYLVLLPALVLTACSPRPIMKSGPQEPIVVPGDYTREGDATFYGLGFDGRKTASGEVFDQYALTAAHPNLPFGTKVLVTNLANGKQVIVRINDRGPFTQAIIDLSYGAAREIGLLKTGRVKIQVLR
jgi:rare lipoprotein A